MLSVVVPKLKGYDGSSLSCEFSWFDPFRRKEYVQGLVLYYEWSNVLWNIAAFESFVGAKVDRSSVEGIKKAQVFPYQRESSISSARRRSLMSISGHHLISTPIT